MSKPNEKWHSFISSSIGAVCRFHFIYSFLPLSFPHIHFSMCISATWALTSFGFFIAQHLILCSNVCLTARNDRLIKETLRSLNTLLASLHFAHVEPILLLISNSNPLCSDHRYWHEANYGQRLSLIPAASSLLLPDWLSQTLPFKKKKQILCYSQIHKLTLNIMSFIS